MVCVLMVGTNMLEGVYMAIVHIMDSIEGELYGPMDSKLPFFYGCIELVMPRIPIASHMTHTLTAVTTRATMAIGTSVKTAPSWC